AIPRPVLCVEACQTPFIVARQIKKTFHWMHALDLALRFSRKRVIKEILLEGYKSEEALASNQLQT
ncbi:MAG: hypothetical protein KC584_01650, partial [Nitrospira sp.]|nr:hypothetical protein [Nitrospira sp.]